MKPVSVDTAFPKIDLRGSQIAFQPTDTLQGPIGMSSSPKKDSEEYFMYLERLIRNVHDLIWT